MEDTEMPLVAECDVRECAYNTGDRCHARAITIGDGLHPACDTFVRSPGRMERSAAIAGVGACKVSSCAHNSDLECQALSIRVGYHGDHPDCLTFEKP
jgi:hypothetical protein